MIVVKIGGISGFPCHINVCSGFSYGIFSIPPGSVINDKSNIYYLSDVYEIRRYSNYLGGNDMKTTTQELKQYITRLFQLSNNEAWECEALEEAAENILPTRFVDHTPLAHLTLETYTYYNDELHELSIYPFLMYANNQLISIGYLDHFDMDFLYLTDTKNTIIDERHLLKRERMTMNNWIKVAQISVTVINEIIDIMKEKQNGGK